jgi:hypothetical protein
MENKNIKSLEKELKSIVKVIFFLLIIIGLSSFVTIIPFYISTPFLLLIFISIMVSIVRYSEENVHEKITFKKNIKQVENKTALQELLSYINNDSNHYFTRTGLSCLSVETTKKIVEELLLKEKEQIETALIKGNTLESYGFIDKKYAENYYNKNYNNEASNE